MGTLVLFLLRNGGCLFTDKKFAESLSPSQSLHYDPFPLCASDFELT